MRAAMRPHARIGLGEAEDDAIAVAGADHHQVGEGRSVERLARRRSDALQKVAQGNAVIVLGRPMFAGQGRALMRHGGEFGGGDRPRLAVGAAEADGLHPGARAGETQGGEAADDGDSSAHASHGAGSFGIGPVAKVAECVMLCNHITKR
jgi:hypothetical protein